MRKLISALFAIGGGASLMLQVGPHDAATNVCNWLSVWHTCLQSLPDWFDRWAWVFPATLFGAAIAILIWTPVIHLVAVWRDRHGLIDLRGAAAQLYGEIRGTDLARFTEGLTDSPDQILDSLANQILHNAPVQVRRAPSPKWEPFPRNQLNKMGACEGATGIRYWGEKQAFYSDPKISRRDLRRVIKHLKKKANLVSEWSKVKPPEQSEKLANREPDIDAREAFFRILEESEWRENQLRTTIDTTHLVPDWLERRLDNEIHKTLRNSRLASWGEECLPGTAMTPEKPIPPETWDKVEIHFDRMQQFPRTGAHWKGRTSRELGGLAWVAIRFSKEQIFKLFPLVSRPLKIIFDHANRGRKFWSIETAKDENGKALGTYWEYRALIKNDSPNTLRNVKAVVEAIGPLPSRPQPSYFDINKQQLIDLHPEDEALVVIRRWFNPPIVVGMACGTDIYGPIKMTVSANDVPPTTKLFHFDPERTPMIFE
jgi:hypothetical protein